MQLNTRMFFRPPMAGWTPAVREEPLHEGFPHASVAFNIVLSCAEGALLDLARLSPGDEASLRAMPLEDLQSAARFLCDTGQPIERISMGPSQTFDANDNDRIFAAFGQDVQMILAPPALVHPLRATSEERLWGAIEKFLRHDTKARGVPRTLAQWLDLAELDAGRKPDRLKRLAQAAEQAVHEGGTHFLGFFVDAVVAHPGLTPQDRAQLLQGPVTGILDVCRTPATSDPDSKALPPEYRTFCHYFLRELLGSRLPQEEKEALCECMFDFEGLTGDMPRLACEMGHPGLAALMLVTMIDCPSTPGLRARLTGLCGSSAKETLGAIEAQAVKPSWLRHLGRELLMWLPAERLASSVSLAQAQPHHGAHDD